MKHKHYHIFIHSRKLGPYSKYAKVVRVHYICTIALKTPYTRDYSIENLYKIMHLHFDFDACLVHLPFRFLHLMLQTLSMHALFCLHSLTKVSMQLLFYKHQISSRVHPCTPTDVW